jgi:hypothetical protein
VPAPSCSYSLGLSHRVYHAVLKPTWNILQRILVARHHVSGPGHSLDATWIPDHDSRANSESAVWLSAQQQLLPIPGQLQKVA